MATEQDTPQHTPSLVLASTSVFRCTLLERLGLEFCTAAPNIDESTQGSESAQQLVVRLAEAKARAVAGEHPHALIIGSDQVACIDGRILGKPGDRRRAIEQLTAASGKRVSFYTGLCLLNPKTDTAQLVCEPYHVHFRPLAKKQIEHYLEREQPYGCAGSFRSEGLGIALFARMEGDDPNALVGLPLIRLIDLLQNEGIRIL